MNGSTKDVSRLHTPVRAGSLSDHELVGLLPVVHANLDPMLIPSLDILDSIENTTTLPPSFENVTTALSSLATIIRSSNFLLDTCPDLEIDGIALSVL